MIPQFDTFWTRSYRGWFIHGKFDRVNHREIITVQAPDRSLHNTRCTTLDGAKANIRRRIAKGN